MAEESGIGAVKETIRALRKEKAEEKDGSKRKILGRKIHRLKKKTRRLSQQAKLQAPTAAAAPQAEAPAEAAAPAEPAAAAASAATAEPAAVEPVSEGEAAAPVEDAPAAAAEPEVNDDAKDDDESPSSP